MRFGVFRSLQWPEERFRGGLFGEELAALSAAEQHGYEAAWIGEPDFQRYGIAPSLLMSAAQLATRTDRIRIGVSTTLLPSYHPLRMAEETAMLDVMSCGRLEWGVSRGHRGRELEGMGVKADDSLSLFREQLEVVKLAWTGMPFSYDGDFFDFPTLECQPAPEQDAPPIYVAAHARETLEWAGGAGYPLLAPELTSSEGLEGRRALHRESAREAGVDTGDLGAPTIRFVHCGESQRGAREEARSALLEQLDGLAGEEAPALWLAEGLGDDFEAAVELTLDRCAIVGDEVGCRERIAELQEGAGLDYLIAWHGFGSMPEQLALASQRRLIEKVAPAFR